MPKFRRSRINDAVARELVEIIRTVKDPRVSQPFVTVTGADVTGDLKFAKIYYSVIGECDEKELSRGLRCAEPYMRRELAHRLDLRMTPELSFVRDTGTQHGADIAQLLSDISRERESRETGGEDADTGDSEISEA